MKRQLLQFLAVAGLLAATLAAPVAADSWFDIGRHVERGSGDVVTEEREVESFEKIRLTCSADLVVRVGERLSLSVTTDDNLLDNVITEVASRRTLIVDAEGSWRTRRGVLVEISVPELRLVEIEGSGDVEIINLNADAFEIEVAGSGDVDFGGDIKELDISINGSGRITADELVAEMINVDVRGSGDVSLDGRTETLEVEVQGSGDVDARRLKAANVTVEIHGSGDVRVYCEMEFDGAVYGSGDIDVWGDPRHLDRHIDGSGDINRH